MAKSWPELINPLRLADQGTEFSGSYPLATMTRLVPLLHQVAGVAHFHWHFMQDSAGRRVVTGEVAAQLCLTCQRCLTELWLPVARQVCLGIVTDLAAADQLPATLDPLLVEEEALAVRVMVEDELLLALPVVAKHELVDCPAGKILSQYTATDEVPTSTEPTHPFAILQTWQPP